jgi:hypothetical protein
MIERFVELFFEKGFIKSLAWGNYISVSKTRSINYLKKKNKEKTMITVITKNGLEFNFGDKGWLAKEVSQAFYLASCMFCEKCTEFIYNFLEKKSLKVLNFRT